MSYILSWCKLVFCATVKLGKLQQQEVLPFFFFRMENK